MQSEHGAAAASRAARGEDAQEFDWFVGLDWGTAAHHVSVGDATGALIGERRIAHRGPALTGLVEWLATVSGGQLARVAVAIEAPRGAVVETLLEAGVAVFTLNPKQVDRFRDRFSVAGAKDDQFDAHVLRSALRTDRGCFRRLAFDPPVVIQVRELTRALEELRGEFATLTNRLREQVHRMAPDWLALSTNADDPWFWAVLELARTPERARRLRRDVLARLLRAHRVRRVTAAEVQAVLQAPGVFVAPGTVEATTTHIALLLRRVRLVHAQQRECAQQLEALLDALSEPPLPPPPVAPDHDGAGGRGASPERAAATGDGAPGGVPTDVAILRSLPGVGPGVTAVLIAEAMPLLVDRDRQALRATSGVAPVRRQTGINRRGAITMRHACNGRLRDALYHWAMTSTRLDAAARRYYATLRARGHTHGRALRSVADRWLRILMAMLNAHALYDPTRFTVAPDPAT